MTKNVQLLFILFFFTGLLTPQSQVLTEVIEPEEIRSIIFKSKNEGDQFPILKLGDQLTLEFDDLTANENDYYYKIIHCNFDWTPSDLMKQQYLEGIDNQRIITYQNSYNTLQPYSHYTLTLPNRYSKLKITGNYMLSIYNRFDELLFSRKFILYKDAVSVGSIIKRARDLNSINSSQRIQFTINSNGFELVNPQQEVKVAILQNYYWPSAITNLKPQFYSGNQLIYKYDKEASFNGQNEYLFFDTKEIRASNSGINKIQLNKLYEHFLFRDRSRNNLAYTFYPDINGDFFVQILDVEDPNTEADYSIVHFALEYNESIGLNQVYVFGKFNNYALTEENKLKFNEENAMLETDILMKQGVYNYKYVVKNEKGEVNTYAISGNHFETENQYLIIVYYRNFGDMYDSIIGIGTASSINISN
ncbi:DUF5103 domain-containing protein [Ascidiimonas sp. W6]|uniref:type IX secretion system plug protein n=1 Tax=Ascidiimonas meishanensis TaxID=3128903 RepID=UPI0030EEAE7F